MGLIPACAGKTPLSVFRRPAWTAHPRVCGENRKAALFNSTRTGSSPRVRGKRVRRRQHFHSHRLIPACAGKTRRFVPWSLLVWAHPRVCGENFVRLRARMKRMGSSPRVRGKPLATLLDATRRRLIPACAGKTRTQHMNIEEIRAHPRVCGENTVTATSAVTAEGSSPRVRGKH